MNITRTSRFAMFASAMVALALVAFAPVSRATPITQTLTNLPGFNSYTNWTTFTLGSVTLADGTNTLLDMSSTFTVADQGWGNQDQGNGIYAQLMSGGTFMGAINLIAGTSHQGPDTFGPPYEFHTINYVASDLSNFNSVLAAYDWTVGPALSIDVVARPVGYQGWELHVQSGGEFSVTSDSAVPDSGTTAALMGVALVSVVALRRRFVR